MIESSTRGSDVTSSIAPFRKTCEGRGALNALKSQHAGKAVYDRLVKKAEQTLSNKVWNGNTSTSLASHMGAQRKAWISMQDVRLPKYGSYILASQRPKIGGNLNS
jgi:hypothetical protein